MFDWVTESGGGLITFRAFGVTMWLATNRAEARERLPEILPPGWEPGDPGEVTHRLAIVGDDRGTYGVDLGGTYLLEGVPLDLALETMDGVVRTRVALEAPERIFVHAGAVARDGGAMLLPGRSFTGKTTLVAALVRAGAVYYSDEYAPLDADGLVHPYSKPLSVRDEDDLQQDRDVESLGGRAGEQPLPVRAVVATTYSAGAAWRPESLSPGRGALALLAHTVPARERSEQAINAITRAAEGAVVLEGPRGEADELAPVLLRELESRSG